MAALRNTSAGSWGEGAGELSGRTAVIVGGGRGLGRAAALALATQGVAVLVAARRAAPNVAAYSAAKAAVIGFSRALAQEVKGKGIRVACLARAPMDTPMRWDATPDCDRDKVLSPSGVVDLVLYLAGHPDVTLEDPVVPILPILFAPETWAAGAVLRHIAHRPSAR